MTTHQITPTHLLPWHPTAQEGQCVITGESTEGFVACTVNYKSTHRAPVTLEAYSDGRFDLWLLAHNYDSGIVK